MHKVISAHLAKFCDDFAIAHDQDKSFEAFSNYCIAKYFSYDSPEPSDLISEGPEPGIDGMFFVVDDQIVTSEDEIEKIFQGKKNNFEVKCVFIQSKTGENWNKGEINKFESAILDFVSEDPAHDYNEMLLERKSAFGKIIESVGKIKDGRPSAYAYYVTTGTDPTAREILAAGKTIDKQLKATGYFSSVTTELFGRDKILNLWVRSQGAYESTFSIIGSASFPKSKGIEKSYVVTLSAKEFVDKLLRDASGGIRRSVFEENVRDFIGMNESSINTEIGVSLTDLTKSPRFGIMNNGVTIISPDVRLGSNEIYISNFQIVNGCQTSNVVFENYEKIDENVSIMAEIIETKEQDIIDDIVRSTNRQNKIEDYQFLATLDAVKAVEKYFLVRNDDDENKLYFERRPNQYRGMGIHSIRIFDLKEIARCTGAMFLEKADIASRYPNQLVEDLHRSVFDPKNSEEIFYTSAYVHYRFKLLLSNNRIDKVLGKLRWYAFMALRYRICGGKPAEASNRIKVERDCKSIYSFVRKNERIYGFAISYIRSFERTMMMS